MLLGGFKYGNQYMYINTGTLYKAQVKKNADI